MQKWEYAVVNIRSDPREFNLFNSSTGLTTEKVKVGVEFQKRFAALGEEGWELVTSLADYLLYFKRPKE